MSVLIPLIFVSLLIAFLFLLGFIWAVRSGQYEDTCTPAMRPLLEEATVAGPPSLSPSGPPPIS